MRIIHGEGYSKNDRIKFKILVYRNIFLAVSALIEAMDVLKIPYESAASQAAAQELREIQYETKLTITPSEAQDIAGVWKDEGVQKCYQRRREYQLTDSAK